MKSIILGKFIFLFLHIIYITSCSTDPKIDRYNLNEKIKANPTENFKDSAQVYQFDLCELLPQSDWDSAYVIKPYMPIGEIKKLKLKNFNELQNKLEDVTHTDHNVGLLFAKEKTILSYSIVTRSLDFASISHFAKNDCQSFFIKKTKNRKGSYTSELIIKENK